MCCGFLAFVRWDLILSGLVGSVNSICTYPARSLLLQTNLDAGDIIASVGLLCLVELR